MATNLPPEKGAQIDYSKFLQSLFTTMQMSVNPDPGYVKTGTDNTGTNVFSSRKAADSTATNAGANYTDAFLETITPFNVLDEKESTTLNEVREVTKDAKFLSSLDLAVKNKQPKEFTNIFLNHYKTDISKIISKDPDKQNQYSALLGAYSLYNRWDSISPFQKEVGLARTGIEANLGIAGKDFKERVVPGTEGGFGGKGLKIGQGLGLLEAGYNAHALAKNWKQHSTFGKVLAGASTDVEVVGAAKTLGLIGYGKNGAAVPVTRQALDKAGAVEAPAFGVGAIEVPTAGAIPSGYSAIAKGAERKVIAIPTPNVATSALTGGVALANVAGINTIVAGSHQIIKKWGVAPVAAVGAPFLVGGSAIAAGMSALSATNPFLLSGVVAASFLGGSIKTGKEQNQNQRDRVRSSLQQNGLLDKDYSIKLPDGTTANIGLDGSGSQISSFKNPNRTVGDHKDKQSKLSSYDIDYTNDLDYFSGTVGITLSRLINGRKDSHVDQIGGQLGNGALGKIGRGAEFNPGNFNAVMQNQRAMYAQSGIKSKAEGYAFVNKMFSEGRIEDMDVVSMQQNLNMVFDSDFNTASKLNAGRFKGIEEAEKVNMEGIKRNTTEQTLPTQNRTLTPSTKITPPMPVSKEEALARNRARVGVLGAVASPTPQMEVSGGAVG